MIDESVTTDDVQHAIKEMSRLLVGTVNDLAQVTARADRAEHDVDELVMALADLLLAVDTRAWPMIDAAVIDANRVLLGARRAG